MSKFRLLAGVVVLAAAGLPVLAQEKVDLKWKFEKDKPFYQELTTETTQVMKIMGQDVNQKQKQTFYFSWTPEKEEENKSWVIKQKIIGVKVDIEIGGNKISYDSTNPVAAGTPLADFFKAMIGAEFAVTISPEGKVTKVEGRDKFIDGLAKANPQMKQLLEQILSDRALEQMAEPMFAAVPDKPVAKGDAWKREARLVLGPIGSYDATYDYTYEGRDKDLDRIKVAITLKYTPPGAMEGGGLPFRIKSADLATKDAGGTILFDSKAGRVASVELSVKLKGKLNIEIGGMASEVELDQSQKTTVKTSETNPLEKK
jgi:hypothetical protein